jgi:hypothetical protein
VYFSPAIEALVLQLRQRQPVDPIGSFSTFGVTLGSNHLVFVFFDYSMFMFESCYTKARLQPVPYSTVRFDVLNSISNTCTGKN